jgi:hypothetical protein
MKKALWWHRSDEGTCDRGGSWRGLAVVAWSDNVGDGGGILQWRVLAMVVGECMREGREVKEERGGYG